MPPTAVDDWEEQAPSAEEDKRWEWGDEAEKQLNTAGATGQHDTAKPAVNEGGPTARFLTRFTGLPAHDIAEHPNAYLNPFSREYWQKGTEERAAEKANPQQFTMPGAQTYQDIKSGNYAGAAGDVAGTAVAVAPYLMGAVGRPAGIPESAAVSPARTLPGALPRETFVHPQPSASPVEPQPIPPRPGLMLKGDVNPGAPLPEHPAPELLQSRGLATGAQPVSNPSAALGRLRTPQAVPAEPPAAAAQPATKAAPRAAAATPKGSPFEATDAKAWQRYPAVDTAQDLEDTKDIQAQIRDAADREQQGRLTRALEEGYARNTRPRTPKGELHERFLAGEIAGKNLNQAEPAVVNLPRQQAGEYAPVADRRTRVSQAVPEPVQTSTAAPAGPAVTGTETSVRVPGETRQYKAAYQVRELGNVQASHSGVNFNQNPKYSLVNDRDYSNQVNQGKIVDSSAPGKFDPAYLLNDNPDATNGPIVTDSDGNALGGNGRTMILERTYKYNPEGAAAYRNLLMQKAQQFGLDPEKIAGMKEPVLVRQIDDAEFSRPEAKQNAITDFNKKGTAELTPAERAISDSVRVSPETLDQVAERLESAGQDATLADALQGRSGADLLEHLISDHIISPQERAALVSEDGLTEAGKERISNLLIGRFFRDSAQLGGMPPSLRGKLERAVAPLTKLDRVPDWDIIPKVQEAVDLLVEAHSHGNNVDDLLRQGGLFGENKYSKDAVTLARYIQKSSGLQFTKAARQYAQDAADAHRSLLVEQKRTPREAFNDAFGQPPTRAAKTQRAAGSEYPAVDLNSAEALQGLLNKSLEAARTRKK